MIHDRQIHTSTQTTPATRHIQGLFRGTRVLTADGALPVEFLSPGDKVITRDRGLVAITRIRSGLVQDCAAVRVHPGTLGNGPDKALLLPQGQQVWLRDWRARALTGRDQGLVAINRLIDGEFITQGPSLPGAMVFQIECAGQHVIYAEGVELATLAPTRQTVTA